ncbi:MAG: hypothetical protein K9J21_00600 [Bacteroidales bacterium]|nr:hypothetical protein [Bacteroidales bacterium]
MKTKKLFTLKGKEKDINCQDCFHPLHKKGYKTSGKVKAQPFLKSLIA